MSRNIIRSVGKAAIYPFRAPANVARDLFRKYGPRTFFKKLERSVRKRLTAPSSPPYTELFSDLGALLRHVCEELRQTRAVLAAQQNDLQRVIEQNEQFVLTCLKTQSRDTDELAAVAAELSRILTESGAAPAGRMEAFRIADGRDSRAA